uniref:Uncharacterized protein n=1 Tax=Rhizophora mucronata TaxID=61149 RepID=A0A2P2J732_RHIMU
MEISFVAPSPSRTPPCLPFSSSHSTFYNSTALVNRTKKSYSKSLIIVKTRSREHGAKKGLTCNALFGLGVPELVVIVGVAALVFGPKKLPEVGRSIGKTVKSFQQVGNFIWVCLISDWFVERLELYCFCCWVLLGRGKNLELNSN